MPPTVRYSPCAWGVDSALAMGHRGDVDIAAFAPHILFASIWFERSPGPPGLGVDLSLALIHDHISFSFCGNWFASTLDYLYGSAH